jgi:2,5-furandicarboxylate decarboxylase 1
MTTQDLRSFVEQYEAAYPGSFVRVADPVCLDYEIQAVVSELERQRRFPILLFENIQGSNIPVITNVYANRRTFAHALGTDLQQLPTVYSRRLQEFTPPVVVDDPPFRHTILEGPDADLSRLPIPTYFPGDAAPYITAGMLVGRDPDTGVHTMGYHRFMFKGPDKLGVSLHSRRRMFEYQRRAEERGKNFECALVLGLHPLVGMGALSYPPASVSKFEAVGGLFQEPMQIAACHSIDVMVPAWGEIVIEGEILAGTREKEGPFGEFTGYFSRRSTEHVFKVKAISMREKPWYQSISSGRAYDHVLPLAVLREAEILKAVSRVVPNVRAVHVPTSGAAAFTAFVSIRQTRPGEAKHVIPIVLGVDHYLKFVVVVDDDIDVLDESDVFWAIATRVQADRDLIVISGSLGAILDPSATDQGLTAKFGIDATRPYGKEFGARLQMQPEKEAWAQEFVARLSGN